MIQTSKLPFVPSSPDVEAELRRCVGVLHAGLSGLAAEVTYVLSNCRIKGIHPQVVGSIIEVFQAFQSTVQFDVRDEVLNLEDKLGLRQGLPPHDPDIVNKDPRVTIGFIRDWLGEEFTALDKLVKTLHDGLASILVAETGANMLGIQSGILDALERVEAILAEVKR